MLLPVGAGETRVLPRGQVESAGYLRWLPGSQALILSGYEKGKPRMYTQDIDGGPPRPISPEDFFLCGAPLTPDGLYSVGCSRGKQFLVPVNGGEPRILPGLTRSNEVVGFSSDSRFAYVQILDSLPARVDRVELASGDRREWRTFQPANLTGVTSIGPILLFPDLNAYAYNYESIVSVLYTLDGAI